MSNRRLDAVLPLTNKDYERFEILRKSLECFFPDLDTCWVVVADREYDDIRAKIWDSRYRVIAESTIIPELRFYDCIRVIAGRSHKPLHGWVSQQLRKLAIAQHINSQFYLTLDADIVCTRRVRYSDLIINGRALSDRGPIVAASTMSPKILAGNAMLPGSLGAYHRCMIAPAKLFDTHNRWYERAAQVLGVRIVNGWHNLAPALLSREAVIMLQKHLASRVHPALRVISGFLHGQSAPNDLLVSWRSYLLRNHPWTEYALYYTFLEAMHLYDRYHFVHADTVLQGNSVWKREELASWQPRKSFGGKDRPTSFFSVIQSSLEIPAAQVWEKVRPYLESTG
jgi:Family of unknown function (DUF6492)